MRDLTASQSTALNGTKFIDLFAGMGGFHLALSSFGSELAFASEWDTAAQSTYLTNYGVTPHGDITQINDKDIPDHDILCAGFPCQAFSISGKQLGFSDTRGTLFFDVARIVKEKKPRVVFLENVRNFASHDGGRTLQVVRETMDSLGYQFHWKIIDQTKHNVPQKRLRAYMVCFREQVDSERFHWPAEEPMRRTVMDALEPSANISANLWPRQDDMVIHKAELLTPSADPYRLAAVGKGRQGERIYSVLGSSITFSAYGGGRFNKTGGYMIDGRARRLTPREAARIMGYPDSYVLHSRDAYKQLGNSVVVPVLQDIAANIAAAINDDK